MQAIRLRRIENPGMPNQEIKTYSYNAEHAIFWTDGDAVSNEGEKTIDVTFVNGEEHVIVVAPGEIDREVQKANERSALLLRWY